MKRIAALFLMLATLATSNMAQAQPYMDAASINPELLTPPPAPHSAPWNADIDKIIALQKSPDQAVIAQAAAELVMAPELVTLAVHPALTRADYPAVYQLLDNVAYTSKSINGTAKDFWHTKRPYQSDNRVKALIFAHDNPAYPSGHTTGSYVWAYVLSELLPQKRTLFMQRAEAIAQHRVLVGMHYPHDLVGGKELALLIMGGLLQNADFRQDFELAKKELAEKHQSTTDKP
jgi:acid phosphatase (class A)